MEEASIYEEVVLEGEMDQMDKEEIIEEIEEEQIMGVVEVITVMNMV